MIWRDINAARLECMIMALSMPFGVAGKSAGFINYLRGRHNSLEAVEYTLAREQGVDFDYECIVNAYWQLLAERCVSSKMLDWVFA